MNHYTQPTYKFVNIPSSVLGQSPENLDLKGRRLSRYPRPLGPGEVWAVVDVRTGSLAHVSYFGEGVGKWIFSPEDAYSAAIQFPGLRDELLPFALQVTPRQALGWAARFPEDRFLVIPRILQGDNENVLLWAYYFPDDREHVKQWVGSNSATHWGHQWPRDIPWARLLVTESEDAFLWCKNVEKTPEARAALIQYVTDPQWAFHWAHNWPSDREHLRVFVNTPEWAYRWALRFPDDREGMRLFVHGPEWSYRWARDFPEDRKGMYPAIAESPMWKERWVRDLGRGRRVLDVPLGNTPEVVLQRKVIESQGRPGTPRDFLVEEFYVDSNTNVWCLRLSREEGFPDKWYLSWWYNNKFKDMLACDVFSRKAPSFRYAGKDVYTTTLVPVAQGWERNTDSGHCSALTDAKQCATLTCS